MAIKIYYIPPMKKEKLTKITRLTRSRLTNTLKISSAIITAIMIDLKRLYANDAMGKLDKAGNEILTILQRIGYWGALLMAFWETIGAIKDGDVNRVWGIGVKYAVGYAALYALPWVFEIIGTIFA